MEQWALFAGPGSVFNADHSVNSGFAVDTWRTNPFFTATDVFTNAPVENLFDGVQVDVAVRDVDAWLYRVSYKITLLGKIVFSSILIE